jgi:hypothetical protein
MSTLTIYLPTRADPVFSTRRAPTLGRMRLPLILEVVLGRADIQFGAVLARLGKLEDSTA